MGVGCETTSNLSPVATVSGATVVTSTVIATTTISSSPFVPPLDQALSRITKKPFGIFIVPSTSPVQPERFHGYHTGVDFETFSDEQNIVVAVHAICDGKLLRRAWANGYGGMVVEACTFNKEPITVVYGHLNIASVTVKIGENLTVGDTIGMLGKGFSTETDGERKHLHLGIHIGASVDARGYVATKSELRAWVDFAQYLK